MQTESTLFTETTRKASLLYQVSKRLIDIVLATFGLVVLMPVFLAIAICIKLDDGGEILYIREMIGLQGRRFFLLKFRTMIPDADAYLEKHPELKQEFLQNRKLKHDPRVTRVGRFLRKAYLDELLQLFNILVGQMSLVGPRAIHQDELALYREYAQKRHSVKPGLTGLWQISPNRYSCYEERIPLDMQYIDNCSFIFDLTILMKTLKVFIAHSGV
jgi:exopolysaccharide production protein ExoY